MESNKAQTDELEQTVHNILHKVRQNLDASVKILEAISQEQSNHLKLGMREANQWNAMTPATQPQLLFSAFMKQSTDNFRSFMEAQRRAYMLMELSWRLPMFCMLPPDDFIREIRNLLPYGDEQILRVLQELETQLETSAANPADSNSSTL